MEDKTPDFAHILKMQEIDEMQKEINELKEEKNRRGQYKKEEITLAQQLLLLHYTGLLNIIDLPNTGKSALLSKILNRSADNIRKNITYINSPKISHSKIKKVENLELVLNIIESLPMPEAADKVKVDLKKIKGA